jgi:hypothetical protein
VATSSKPPSLRINPSSFERNLSFAELELAKFYRNAFSRWVQGIHAGLESATDDGEDRCKMPHRLTCGSAAA